MGLYGGRLPCSYRGEQVTCASSRLDRDQLVDGRVTLAEMATNGRHPACNPHAPRGCDSVRSHEDIFPGYARTPLNYHSCRVAKSEASV